jgi:hypothetical protein
MSLLVRDFINNKYFIFAKVSMKKCYLILQILFLVQIIVKIYENNKNFIIKYF